MAVHNMVGALGEYVVAARLAQFGDVLPSARADLRVGDLDVEVKAARRAKINQRLRGYQFCLARAGRRGLDADFLVMVCFDDEFRAAATFVIPAAEVGERRQTSVRLTEAYAEQGQWSPHRDRWDLIGEQLGVF